MTDAPAPKSHRRPRRMLVVGGAIVVAAAGVAVAVAQGSGHKGASTATPAGASPGAPAATTRTAVIAPPKKKTPPTPAVNPATQRQIRRMIAANAIFVKGGARGRLVALTFDDGPSIYTPSLVRELRQLKAPATFFEIGSQIHRYSTLVANMTKFGFPIEDHTWNHPDLTRLSSAQVQGQLLWTKNAIFKAAHVYPQFFRPPYGAQNARVRRAAGGLGMVTTVWSIDTRDWSRPGTSAIIHAAEQVRAGGIVLMHDGGGNRSETLAAVPVIVRYLRAHGYTLVTVPQLLTKAPPKLSTTWLSATHGGG